MVARKEDLDRAFDDLRIARNYRPAPESPVNWIQLIQVVIFAITAIVFICLI